MYYNIVGYTSLLAKMCVDFSFLLELHPVSRTMLLNLLLFVHIYIVLSPIRLNFQDVSTVCSSTYQCGFANHNVVKYSDYRLTTSQVKMFVQ